MQLCLSFEVPCLPVHSPEPQKTTLSNYDTFHQLSTTCEKWTWNRINDIWHKTFLRCCLVHLKLNKPDSVSHLIWFWWNFLTDPKWFIYLMQPFCHSLVAPSLNLKKVNSNLNPWHVLLLTSICLSTGREPHPGSDTQVLHQIWGCCTYSVSVCALCVWVCTWVYVCMYECHVRATQAVLLLWYRLYFTKPPLGGRTPISPSSHLLCLTSDISIDLQKHKKSWSVSEHNHNLSTHWPRKGDNYKLVGKQ